MCGIAGWINIPPSTRAPLEKMLDLIRHRGPDETKTYSDKNFAAGMVRLSINGLSNGSQPLWSFSGKIALFYNGDIYNSPKLRNELERQGIRFKSDSDGEVLSHLFDVEGPKAFSKLVGMFAAFTLEFTMSRIFFILRLPSLSLVMKPFWIMTFSSRNFFSLENFLKDSGIFS